MWWNDGRENYMCGMTNYGPAGSGAVPTRESTAHGVFVYSQYYWSNGNTEWPYMGSLADCNSNLELSSTC